MLPSFYPATLRHANLACRLQEVEYVKEEAKMVYLLECLQKTSPPVLIFAEKKQIVDSIHEYLLLKGVQVISMKL